MNAQGGDYANALQAASYEGQNLIVPSLLEHMADAHAQDAACGDIK